MVKVFLQKFITLAASCALAFTVPTSASAEREIIGYMGDLNRDMTVGVADLVLMSRYLQQKATLSNSAVFYADVNFDNSIDVFDFVILRQYILGVRDLDPIFGKELPPDVSTTTPKTTTATTTSHVPATTTTVDRSSFIEAPVNEVESYLPSQGLGNLVIFYVDFPDCQYSYAPTAEELDAIAFGDEDEENVNYPFCSMHAFFERSSKGVMNLQGKAFRYTAKENLGAYESNRNKLVMECYNAFRESEDFAKYDGDGDGYIDATLINVPTRAGDSEWWPCAGPVGRDDFTVDGKKLGFLITGNAQISSADNYYSFNNTYLHEMGHCMGLPDYYLYNRMDNVGLHGSAGAELMDVDSSTDFCAFSKLQLGWYKKDQVMIYDSSEGTQTFTLNNAQHNSGNCLIIPCGDIDSMYKSEYFIVEYNTTDKNNSNPAWWQQTDSGIRVFHVDASIFSNGSWVFYKYESGSYFTNNDEGRRLIRIIDDTDTDNYYRNGDVIDSSISGFKWYDGAGNETVDPGLKITVGEQSGDSYTITVSKK